MSEKIINAFNKNAPKKPTPPAINDPEAKRACNELNELLRRSDIESNASPSDEGRILTVFVHGYGSSKWLWIDPYFGTFGWLRDYRTNPSPRDYGWHQKPVPAHLLMPYRISFSPLIFPEGVFNYLMRKGHEVLAYSQIDPFGDIDTSAKELSNLLKAIRKIYGKKRIILVGHSRGGICIRKYLEGTKETSVEKVITLSSPHLGTNLTNFKVIKQPAIKILNQTRTIRNIWDVSGQREVKDLCWEQMKPKSPYLLNLKDQEKWPEIEYVAVAGESSIFTHVYAWRFRRESGKDLTKMFSLLKEKIANNSPNETVEDSSAKYHWIAYPQTILTVFKKIFLPEVRKGDGLVAVRSALLKKADREYTFPNNHEEIATSDQTNSLLLNEIKRTSKE
ncbi:MAG: alpha/beta hydrolase [Candidatus Heimdallarchaeota archaeon]|nr:alpha/beta hydrolase [Candidatus Heimdallarchaeota archaeon]